MVRAPLYRQHSQVLVSDGIRLLWFPVVLADGNPEALPEAYL